MFLFDWLWDVFAMFDPWDYDNDGGWGSMAD